MARRFEVCACLDGAGAFGYIVAVVKAHRSDRSHRLLGAMEDSDPVKFALAAAICDHMEWTEHGTSFRCGWLTKGGEEFADNGAEALRWYTLDDWA